MRIEALNGKWLLTLLLTAALVAGGGFFSLPEQAAAAKKTTYNVTVTGESPSAALISVSDGTPFSQEGTGEGITFQMTVDSKLKTEKVKSIKKGTADYYKVDIKKIKIPDTYFTLDGNKFKVTTKASNAKGKLYVSGGDVDVSQLMGKKKPKETIGDGTADPEGSLLIPKLKLTVTVFGPDVGKKKGKKMMSIKTVSTLTTGQSRIVVDEMKKSKSGLADMALPDNGPEGLPNQLKGVPLDLAAGTGALVSTASVMNVKINPKAVPASAKGFRFSIDSTANDLFADPDAKAVLAKYIGDGMTKFEETLSDIGYKTIRQLQKMKPGAMSNDTLAEIDAELKALSAGEGLISLVGDVDLLCGQIWVLQITPANVNLGGNPGYASVVFAPAITGPSGGSLPLYSIESSSQDSVIPAGGSTIITVSVTSLTNVAITGNLIGTAHIYTPTFSGPIAEWVEAEGSPQTIVSYANIIVDPGRTVSFLVPLIAPSIPEPMLIMVKADFVLAS